MIMTWMKHAALANGAARSTTISIVAYGLFCFMTVGTTATEADA